MARRRSRPRASRPKADGGKKKGALSLGDEGPEVTALQVKLARMSKEAEVDPDFKALFHAGKVDGKFEAKLEGAIRALQSNNHAAADRRVLRGHRRGPRPGALVPRSDGRSDRVMAGCRARERVEQTIGKASAWDESSTRPALVPGAPGRLTHDVDEQDRQAPQRAGRARQQEATKKKSARPTNTDPAKQPGFAEQEAALKPAGGKADKITDCKVVITEIRKKDKGKSEADLVCNYYGENRYQPVRSEKRTVKFDRRECRCDGRHHLAGLRNRWSPAGRGHPIENLSDIGPDGFMACLMAVRDQHIVKGLDVGALSLLATPVLLPRLAEPHRSLHSGTWTQAYSDASAPSR